MPGSHSGVSDVLAQTDCPGLTNPGIDDLLQMTNVRRDWSGVAG